MQFCYSYVLDPVFQIGTAVVIWLLMKVINCCSKRSQQDVVTTLCKLAAVANLLMFIRQTGSTPAFYKPFADEAFHVTLSLCISILVAVLADPTLLMIDTIYATFMGHQFAKKNKMDLTVCIATIAIQLYVWVPIVAKYAATHCFLDGFMKFTNPSNTFITVAVLVLNTLFVGLMTSYFSFSNRTYLLSKIAIMLVAFFNTTCAFPFWIILLQFGYVI
jgi:hypothetical protein